MRFIVALVLLAPTSTLAVENGVFNPHCERMGNITSLAHARARLRSTSPLSGDLKAKVDSWRKRLASVQESGRLRDAVFSPQIASVYDEIYAYAADLIALKKNADFLDLARSIKFKVNLTERFDSSETSSAYAGYLMKVAILTNNAEAAAILLNLPSLFPPKPGESPFDSPMIDEWTLSLTEAVMNNPAMKDIAERITDVKGHPFEAKMVESITRLNATRRETIDTLIKNSSLENVVATLKALLPDYMQGEVRRGGKRVYEGSLQFSYSDLMHSLSLVIHDQEGYPGKTRMSVKLKVPTFDDSGSRITGYRAPRIKVNAVSFENNVFHLRLENREKKEGPVYSELDIYYDQQDRIEYVILANGNFEFTYPIWTTETFFINDIATRFSPR